LRPKKGLLAGDSFATIAKQQERILAPYQRKYVNIQEYTDDGVIRTNIYYCNPYSSWQKGILEKNHEYVRYVLPKGRSFNELKQKHG